jgi:hypothetical protein
MNVESYGGHGVAINSGALSPLSSMFPHLMHYARAAGYGLV